MYSGYVTYFNCIEIFNLKMFIPADRHSISVEVNKISIKLRLIKKKFWFLSKQTESFRCRFWRVLSQEFFAFRNNLPNTLKVSQMNEGNVSKFEDVFDLKNFIKKNRSHFEGMQTLLKFLLFFIEQLSKFWTPRFFLKPISSIEREWFLG